MAEKVKDIYALACRDFMECLGGSEDDYFSCLDQMCFHVHAAYAQRNVYSDDALAILELYRDLLDLLHTELSLRLDGKVLKVASL